MLKSFQRKKTRFSVDLSYLAVYFELIFKYPIEGNCVKVLLSNEAFGSFIKWPLACIRTGYHDCKGMFAWGLFSERLCLDESHS